MKRGFIFLGITGLFLLLIILSFRGGLPERFKAPDFSLKDIFTGREIRLSDFRERPTLLYFFASW